MPLNIGSSGETANYVKFNAKSGRLSINDADGNQPEIPGLTAIFDLENIRTGWLRFREGQAPERHFDPRPGDSAPKPEGEGFKRGFLLMLFSRNTLGGVRELSGNSLHLCNAITDLYAAWEAGKDDYRGQVPVVTMDSVQPMKDQYGTNYRPVFRIVKWVDRPADLVPPMVEASVPSSRPTSGQAPVPPPQPQPDPLMSSEF
jgi:hypothetical protein